MDGLWWENPWKAIEMDDLGVPPFMETLISNSSVSKWPVPMPVKTYAFTGLKIIKVLYTSRVTFGPWSLKIWHSPCTSTHQKFHRRCVRAERRERCKLWDGSRHNIAWYWIHPQTKRGWKIMEWLAMGWPWNGCNSWSNSSSNWRWFTTFYIILRFKKVRNCHLRSHPPYFHTFFEKKNMSFLWHVVAP